MGAETSPNGPGKEAAGSRHEPEHVRQTATANTESIGPQTHELIEEVLRRENLLKALRRVQSNKGAPGVDGMRVEELPDYLRKEWHTIREQLLSESYVPSPVREVQLPKPGGGTRMLGIPTVLDRFITQAMLQVMSLLFDTDFSDHSYGFRPGRSALQAVGQARDYIAQGHRWVVDLDLERDFSTRSITDMLMSRVAKKVEDKRLLRLIRRYLNAGIMKEGMVSIREAGTPQGSPLSPLLSNILLDDLDKELERRGHRFCRYADDANVYVRSQRAGECVMESLTRFLEDRLRLKVNRTKSAVGRPWKRKFLGYTVTTQFSPRLKPASRSAQTRQGPDSPDHPQGTGTKHSSGDQRDQFVHPRMGRLLSLGHGETRFRVTGSMDSPAPAQDIVGAMEETEDPVSKVSSLGTRGTACAQGHRDRAWCLVECGSLTHAFGREQSFYSRSGVSSTFLLNSGPCSGALEPPYTDPYVRWCGRTGEATLPPTRCAPGMARSAVTGAVNRKAKADREVT